ncbi:NUDIX hydrolase [Methylopila henanensis]|uniref:NUDIX hydrolase n=1 Tax=Methylopila henanensis TaxID=873516 RepID=A0ABW4KA93_9HYPH
MAKREKLAKKVRQQYGALPFREAPGGVEVLLITTRETRRWIIPKGWPMKGRTPVYAARREAFEEAGLHGDPLPEVGQFEYVKRMAFGADRPCRVGVFPLRVTEELADWPEKDERERRWFSLPDAAAAVIEPDLSALILALPSHLADG